MLKIHGFYLMDANKHTNTQTFRIHFVSNSIDIRYQIEMQNRKYCIMPENDHFAAQASKFVN